MWMWSQPAVGAKRREPEQQGVDQITSVIATALDTATAATGAAAVFAVVALTPAASAAQQAVASVGDLPRDQCAQHADQEPDAEGRGTDDAYRTRVGWCQGEEEKEEARWDQEEPERVYAHDCID